MGVPLSRRKWAAACLLLWVFLACAPWVGSSARHGVVGAENRIPGVLSSAPSESHDAVARLNEGRTALRFVDDGGNPVAGVPVYVGFDSATGAMPSQIGVADADGVYHPEQFPVILGAPGWQATEEWLTMEDDGRERVLTVTRACDVALSWDLPPGPNPDEINVEGAGALAVALGHALLHVPCGELSVGASERGDEAASAVQLVGNHFDSREPTAHLEWKTREGITVCVEDEEGSRIPGATVGGTLGGWPRGDCWGVDALPWCVEVEAGGFLSGELCPEDGVTWQKTRYDMVLERAREVAYTCKIDGESGECTAEQVFEARCVSAATPDFGPCDRDAQTCDCPDAPDAHLLCTSGDFAGESAAIRGGTAEFSQLGTASITIPGGDFCGAWLSRIEGHVRVDHDRVRCESGGAVWTGLVAGTYAVELRNGTPQAKWRQISLADGEQKVLPLQVPAGLKLEIEWVGGEPAMQFATVRLENMETGAMTAPGMFMVGSPGVADLLIPTGADVWVCGEAGCCHYEDAVPPLRCEPDVSVRPPAQED